MTDNNQYYIRAEAGGAFWDVQAGDQPHNLGSGRSLQGSIAQIADKYAELRKLEQLGGNHPRLEVRKVGSDSVPSTAARATIQAALTRRGVAAPRLGL